MKNRLEEIRKQRGMKQEELAAALQVSRQTIGSLENGRYNPSIWNREILVRYKLREEFVIHLVTYIAYKSLNDWKICLDLRYINRLIKDILIEFSLGIPPVFKEIKKKCPLDLLC